MSSIARAFSYTPRHLISFIDHDTSNLVPGQSVSPTADVSFSYDAAGNRTQMTDGLGTATYHYDSLSRMDWEERTLAGLTGAYRLTYEYNNVGLAKVINPAQLGSSQVAYTVDHTGASSKAEGGGRGARPLTCRGCSTAPSAASRPPPTATAARCRRPTPTC